MSKQLLFLIFTFCFSSTFAQNRTDSALKNKSNLYPAADTIPVYFSVGDYSLNKGVLQTLDSVFLLLNAGEKISLYGYADQRGENKGNLSLSTKRAGKIKDFFLSKGFPDSAVSAYGKGIQASDNSLASLQKSRKVDIVLRAFSLCQNVVPDRKFRPLYFHFNTNIMEDSSLAECNKLIDYLKKNPCIKARIFTYKICDICKNEENIKLAKTGTVELKDVTSGHGEQLLKMMEAKGINISQFVVRQIYIGCKNKVSKSIVQSVTIKE